jgi:hypothetical protein
MGAFKNFGAKLGIVGSLFSFFWKNKKWWLFPVLFVLVAIGLILVFAQSSAIGPFIYSLF